MTCHVIATKHAIRPTWFSSSGSPPAGASQRSTLTALASVRRGSGITIIARTRTGRAAIASDASSIRSSDRSGHSSSSGRVSFVADHRTRHRNMLMLSQ